MIKLLLLLCVFLSLYGEQRLFDFPRQNGAFNEHIHRMFRQNDQIMIVTPSLNHSGLKKELLTYVKNGNSLMLIVQNLKHDPLYLVQYKGIQLYQYQKRPLTGTIILGADGVCCLSAPLNADNLSREKSMGWCSDDPEIVFQSHSLYNTIQEHSTLYLK